MLVVINLRTQFSRLAIFSCLSLVSLFGTVAAIGSEADIQDKFLAAAAKDDAAVIVKLIDQGVHIETRNGRGATALLLATQNNAINVARILVKAGADVNAKDKLGDSAYLYAGAEGRLDILRMTLDHGADLASVNRYGGTALIPAAHHGHIETVRVLVATDTDIDHINYLGWTALLEAIILGDGSNTYIEIVRLLVNAGANVKIADRDGVSPLIHASQSGYSEIVEILKAKGTK